MEISVASLILSIVFTWGLGLSIPLILRHLIFKRPLAKIWAIIIATINFILMLTAAIALGSQSKTHAALILVAFVSYSSWVFP